MVEKTIETLKLDSDTTKFTIHKIQERIAVIEERQRTGEKDRDELKADNKEQKLMLQSVDTKLDSIREDFAKLKGTWGGIILAVTSVGTFLAFTWEWFYKLFKNGI